ncbi:hypothetical protein ACIRPP_15065 [Streptomyces sp. NPDC101219]|uniref:hypothetical protein n=1 Tax=Streptomyces sp. NPDC101219 TaxID=3366131 RepID=UPI0037FDBE73
MFEYEFQKLRQQELIGAAEEQRRVREAVRVRRAARRDAGARGAADESHSRRTRRYRFARAA